jgi:branched-chain amino acid transport system substrate-binding protein
MVFITDMKSLGLEVAQGSQFVTAWYWDMDDEAREWAERFHERVGSMPTMVQAGNYSAVTSYLKAVEATGSDDPAEVRAYLMENPIEDFFARNGRLREDGRMVHDMYLARVKSPRAVGGGVGPLRDPRHHPRRGGLPSARREPVQAGSELKRARPAAAQAAAPL